MKSIIFKASGISKHYGGVAALDGLNMQIEQGDIYGFVGENGAGKSTLMKIICGLVYPTQGSLELLGTTELSKARARLGVLIEHPALYPHMNAEQNLQFYCKLYGITDTGRIGNVLRLVGLAHVGTKNTSDYSLGMRQRLGLAIALLNNPVFMILDEPTNGLDPAGIVEMRRILTRLVAEEGVTILISSHMLSELQLLATKFGFIHKGRLIHEVTAQELLRSAESQICIKTSEPEAAIKVLEHELHIHDIAATERGELMISKDLTDLEQLMSIFIKQGIPIEGIQLSLTNLEHYYMDLIGE
ncbi:bacitracin ABC transporter ATP-binding protein [Paenibacillus albidus]|uniref:Bacitracin ABC transporter ATP-binding protein n=1 Tax=Paenibacillus albidus TaxID=2041023 RepID=A0A917CYE4_9BACL|nr:ATP-binding cassette domain-containing protein [Paenibacillus albidus]GGG01531.1 bacitracin ABC transporter ATP-binding protein [Paenibacillus albidus]